MTISRKKILQKVFFYLRNLNIVPELAVGSEDFLRNILPRFLKQNIFYRPELLKTTTSQVILKTETRKQEILIQFLILHNNVIDLSFMPFLIIIFHSTDHIFVLSIFYDFLHVF